MCVSGCLSYMRHCGLRVSRVPETRCYTEACLKIAVLGDTSFTPQGGTRIMNSKCGAVKQQTASTSLLPIPGLCDISTSCTSLRFFAHYCLVSPALANFGM